MSLTSSSPRGASSRFTFLAAGVAVIIPSLVLIGWLLRVAVLKSVAPGLVAMNPATAVAFILCGTALALLSIESRKSAAAVAAVVAVIGTLKVAGITLQVPINIDRILFAARLDAETVPNRMAPNTATNFVLIGIALTCAAARGRRWVYPTQVLALAVATFAFLALIGYAYRVATLYDVGAYIPMALHTAAAFLLLALGLLSVRTDEGVMRVVTRDSPGGRLARRLLPVTILLPALLGWLRLGGAARGWVTPDFGTTLLVLANTVVFTALVWWELALLDKADQRRRQAEQLVREQNRLLEQAVQSQRQAHEALKATQSQLVQSEKLAGLGLMVAGVAHEINNPLAFVSNNVAVLQRDLSGLCDVLALYRRAAGACQDDAAAILNECRELAERVDVTYTIENLPDLLSRSRDGLRRIQQIVKDLRDFARLDESAVQEADLNAGVESTLNIINGHAKKKRVVIERRLGDLPPVRCHPAKVNQVVMNLSTNAIDASAEGGRVVVTTRSDDGCAVIEVSDEGAGIEESIRQRIFDPFFTTKPPGQGTGLGLSISYGIVRDHGGRIDVWSEKGMGSRFTVRLPLDRSGPCGA
jgi:signal transduction histidine kinase